MKQEDKLRAYWSKGERDIMLHWPGGESTRADGHYLSGLFDKEFTEEMKRRGYDLRTLKFSIEPMAGNQRFTSQRNDNESEAN